MLLSFIKHIGPKVQKLSCWQFWTMYVFKTH